LAFFLNISVIQCRYPKIRINNPYSLVLGQTCSYPGGVVVEPEVAADSWKLSTPLAFFLQSVWAFMEKHGGTIAPDVPGNGMPTGLEDPRSVGIPCLSWP
jgi:hypothetical protein